MFVILVYDFGERRVAKALKICRKYLTWIQNSVFEGEITDGKYSMLTTELERVMNKDNDSLIIFQFRSKRYTNRVVIGMEKNELSNMI